jgi:hypothetical protein
VVGANIESEIGKAKVRAWLRHWQADLIDLKIKLTVGSAAALGRKPVELADKISHGTGCKQLNIM